MTERLVRAGTRHRVPDDILHTVLPTPRIVLDDTVLEHRAIRLEALPDSVETELVEAAERGQARRGEGSVEQVEVFRRTGSVRTSILEDLDVYPRTGRNPTTTPSTAKSPFEQLQEILKFRRPRRLN